MRAEVEKGQVAWGTFSGPTLSGHRLQPASVAPSTSCSRVQVEATANGGLRPHPKPPTPALGWHAKTWQANGVCSRAAVVPTGAGPIRGVCQPVQRTSRVEAASLCASRRCPASVVRRTGAPPPPWRRNPRRKLATNGSKGPKADFQTASAFRVPPVASRSVKPLKRCREPLRQSARHRIQHRVADHVHAAVRADQGGRVGLADAAAKPVEDRPRRLVDKASLQCSADSPVHTRESSHYLKPMPLL